MDISEGGLLMESAGGVDVGQEVALELMVPYVVRLLKVHARVVRKEAGDRIGVRFLALQPEPREAIRRFIQWGVGK